jgi:hypothetical protein
LELVDDGNEVAVHRHGGESQGGVVKMDTGRREQSSRVVWRWVGM